MSSNEVQQNIHHTEIHHEHTVAPEPIAKVGGFTITNSLLTSWVVVLIIIVLSIFIRKNIKKVPGKIQNGFEMMIEGFLSIFDSLTGSREMSLKVFPFVFTLFLFILLNNWMSLIPGLGSIGQVIKEGGEKYFVPYLRGGTADLNTNLALAIIGVVASHIAGIISIGVWKYFNKFINIEALIEIPKKVKQEPTVLLINPIKVFTGFIEIISEIAKVASLSFRLFGNIFAGEVLLAFMAGIFAFGLPLPFMFLEVLVGLIQALIFAMLVLAYFVTMMSVEEEYT